MLFGSEDLWSGGKFAFGLVPNRWARRIALALACVLLAVPAIREPVFTFALKQEIKLQRATIERILEPIRDMVPTTTTVVTKDN